MRDLDLKLIVGVHDLVNRDASHFRFFYFSPCHLTVPALSVNHYNVLMLEPLRNLFYRSTICYGEGIA